MEEGLKCLNLAIQISKDEKEKKKKTTSTAINQVIGARLVPCSSYLVGKMNDFEWALRVSSQNVLSKKKKMAAHHWELATTPYSCHGVFTDRSIFSLSGIQLPTGATVPNSIAITSTD